MNGLTSISFLFICFFFLYCGHVDAQSTELASITGSVTDSTSGTPLHDAHVFLSGTSIGTSTNHAGRYTLTNLPPGSHTLTVSIIGYGRYSEDISIKASEEKVMNPELKPVVYDLGELYVGNLDEKWERHLSRFEDLFIGETSRADSVTILNPEVLRFETRWWGRFTAEALAPLEIENRATGYTITYHLDDFRHSGTVTRWDGDSFFTPLTPKDSVQAAYWAEQRQEVFYGSLRHFFLSLVNNQLESQQFSIFLQNRQSYGYPPSTRRPIKKDRILKDTDEDQHFHLSYYGQLEIVYRGQKEESGYLRWANKRRGVAYSQISHLKLDERPVTIDPNGEIVETYGATRMGYMAYKRFAEALPKEYLPEPFIENVTKSALTSNQ